MEGIVFGLILALLYHYRQRSVRAAARRAAADKLRAAARREADADFNLVKMLPALRQYVRVGSQVVPVEVLESPPVSEPPPVGGRTTDYLKRAVLVALERFGLGVPPVKVRFASLPKGHAARVRRDDQGVWMVDVDRSLEHHPDAILSAVAHEVAHIALLGRGIELESTAANEELTDTAAVLAGFGPVMLATVLLETVTASDSAVSLRAQRLGYLPPAALAFLSAMRVEMAGGRSELYLKLVPDWQRSGVEAFILVREEWTRRAAAHRGKQTECLTCAMRLRVPVERARLRMRCRACRFPAIVPAAS